MEKNIKEAMQRQIISTELLNDNALLVTSKKASFQYVAVSICYIDQSKNALVESEICQYDDRLKIEYNEKMVAVFLKDVATPIKVYDLEHKEFVTGDFFSTVYNSEPNKKQFVYKSK